MSWTGQNRPGGGKVTQVSTWCRASHSGPNPREPGSLEILSSAAELIGRPLSRV